MAETSEQLSCVLIPVRDQTLLLPQRRHRGDRRL